MRKLFILSLLIINSFNLVCAQELVLSDRIREAREAAKKEEIKEKVSNIKPVNIKEEDNIYCKTNTPNTYNENFSTNKILK